MAAIDPTKIKNQTITDYQMQAFTDQAKLPAGAVATANEINIVLGNGHTVKIVGIKLAGGQPRLIARDTYQSASEDTDTIA